MSIIPPLRPLTLPGPQTEYLVSHGKSGAFGRFVADQPMFLQRGDRVVIVSVRGQEVGTVLCPANVRHGLYLGDAPSGKLLHRITSEDEQSLSKLTDLSRQLFADSRELATRLLLPVEILDVEILYDGSQAILQYLGGSDADFTPLVEALVSRYHVQVHMENLTLPHEHEEVHGGCGKPDCGRIDGGGCTTCGSGGGCSSCGGGKIDMKSYFAHLRTKMETRHLTPLL